MINMPRDLVSQRFMSQNGVEVSCTAQVLDMTRFRYPGAHKCLGRFLLKLERCDKRLLSGLLGVTNISLHRE